MVHHGVEPAFFALAGRREDGGYLLCASTTHPHKNHARLLSVFARLRKQRPALRLVLTGVRGFVASEVEQAVERLGLGDAVECKGWVTREELYELFRRATAFVYPSQFEGFGMPVLEAMAAGLAVACSDIEPLRTLTAGTCTLFDPLNEDAMLTALERVLALPAAPEAARRAAEFSWQRAAAETLDALEAAAQRR